MMRRLTTRNILVISVVILLTACAELGPGDFTESQLYVFGDSLSDVGNARISTSGLFPDKNYYEGRFTNGPNYADRLATLMSQPMKPSRSYGSNYALGGAQSVAVNAQVFNYSENVELVADPAASYIVWSGGNDLLELITNPTTSLTIAEAITHIENALRTLSSMGAVNIIVPNQIDMGRVPRVQKLEAEFPGTVANATALSIQFNADLTSMLDSLDAVDGIATTRFDTFTLFDTILTDPATYGISNTSDSCYSKDETNLEVTGAETICSNPSSYVFWDSLHPTASVHQEFANALYGTMFP